MDSQRQKLGTGRQTSRRVLAITVAFGSLFVATARPARADVIYFFNNPSGFSSALNELGISSANVLYNAPELELSGTTVEGTTQNGFTLNFSTTGDILTAGGGQARIEAADGSFNDLLIDAADPSVFFRSISFNLNPLTVGTLTFGVSDQFGANAPQVQVVDLRGLFFFGAISIDGQVIDKVSLASTGEVTDIRQVRVGGDQSLGGTATVPEPAAAVLFGAGLVGAGVRRWRQRRA